MPKPKKIVLTGGGTAGHVMPNIALIPFLKNENWEISYIGMREGIEYSLISQYRDVAFYSIKSGKLRRYFNVRNFSDPFKVLVGIFQAFYLLKKLKPGIIFSKGGFVAVPVCIAGFLARVPVVIHESDLTPGLANRIAAKFADVVCTSFEETLDKFKNKKSVFTGTPIRQELLNGEKTAGVQYCKFKEDKPIVLVVGGSLGAQAINTKIREILDRLLKDFNVIHICGKNNVDDELLGKIGYSQYQFVDEKLADLLAAADVVVSRAGSNMIHELLELKKPNLLIPLPSSASRGDQIQNAKLFASKGYSKVLDQNSLSADELYEAILEVYASKEVYLQNMTSKKDIDSTKNILEILNQNFKRSV